jgi:hypothetical protein
VERGNCETVLIDRSLILDDVARGEPIDSLEGFALALAAE